MDFDRFNQMRARAEDVFDEEDPDGYIWLYVYGLYSLVDAVSQLSGEIDESRIVLKQIEGHLHHMQMEAWKK
tara:strand:- start:1409 stop:1624 length:216 start_codon:yes stop_codon:yes gene_type:complete